MLRQTARALAIAALTAFSTVTCSGTRIESLDPAKLPADVRGDYALFAQRCSKCHSLSRPLGSGISSDEQWRLYVNRMRRQPGSGISADDQEHILVFLRYYAAELRRKDADKRGLVVAVPDAQAPPPVSPPPAPVNEGDGG